MLAGLAPPFVAVPAVCAAVELLPVVVVVVPPRSVVSVWLMLINCSRLFTCTS
jgi:hypothetical protein